MNNADKCTQSDLRPYLVYKRCVCKIVWQGQLVSQGQGHWVDNVDIIWKCWTQGDTSSLHRSKVTGKGEVCRQTDKQTGQKQYVLD